MLIVSLTEKGGEAKQLTFEKEEITVGRVQGNDIVLPKGNVSKRHCRIFVQAGRYSVEDYKSTNGTYVNGRKIPEVTQIFGGDKIYVGDFIIKVENAPSQEAASLGNEAGSLSQALGGRRPPPPPARSSQAMRAVADGEAAIAPPEPRRTMTRPPAPPPPPPGRRDSQPAPPLDLGPPPAVGGLADLAEDDEEDILATAPPRPSGAVSLPPPPPPPVFNPGDEVSEGDHESVSTDAVTATRDRDRGLERGLDRGLDRGSERGLAAAVASVPGDPAGWLRNLLASGDVHGVYILGPHAVEVDRGGKRESVSLAAPDAAGLVSTLRGFAGQLVADGVGRDADLVDGTLPDGTRFVAVFPPRATEVSASFQKRARAARTLADLVSDGVLSREMRELLDAAVAARRNILVGGDLAGVRTLLEGLANAIPSRLRVVSVGGVVAAPNAGYTWTTLASEPRHPNLVRAAAALRPDHLLVDVSSTPVAADVLHECAFGQQGAIVTVAARSATDALARLEALAAPSTGPSPGLRALVESTFDVVVHATSLPEGRALVLEVSEPRIDPASGRLYAEPLAVFHVEGGGDGKPAGRFQVTGTNARLASTLAARGVAVSPGTLRR